MKTFKVTFFEKFNIVSVITFHNVTNQDDFCKNIAVNIITLDLDPMVRVESEGKDYTQAVNHFIKEDIADIDKDYAKNWYNAI